MDSGDSVFGNLLHLELLSINSNKLTQLNSSKAFANLSRLTELYISENALASIDADVFDALTSLKVLDLSSNRLSALTTQLLGLDNLETLFISGNGLESLGKQLFSVNATSKIYWLDFSQNKLHAQDLAFLNAHNQLWSGMNYLLLANNQLTALNESSFHGLTNLTHLALENNLLTHIDANTFRGLNTLQNVSLGGNPLAFSDHKYVLGLCRVNGINCTISI